MTNNNDVKTDPYFSECCVAFGGFLGGFLSFGYALYAVYHFLPSWFGSILAFGFFTPFVIAFIVALLIGGVILGVCVGVCFYYCCAMAKFAMTITHKIQTITKKH